MKKWLCAILLVALLTQALPVMALATVVTGKPLTEAELAWAYALAGMNEGAGVYHNGMGLSASMNADQLISWLDEQLSGDLYSVGHKLARMEASLEKLKKQDPEAWAGLTAREDSDAMLARSQELALAAEDLRQTLRYTRDRMSENDVMIEEMTNLMKSDQVYDYEIVRYSERIRDAGGEIESMRRDMLKNSKTWLKTIDTLDSICSGTYRGNNVQDRGMSDWLSDVFQALPDPVEVKANLVVSNRTVTRSSRLSADKGVLNNGLDDSTSVHVLSKTEVGFVLKNSKGEGVKDIDFSIRDAELDADDPNAKFEKKQTNDRGEVYFDISSFKVNDDNEVNVYILVDTRTFNETSAEKYRAACVVQHKMVCGTKYEAVIADDDGSPYIYRGTFNGADFMMSELQFYYSDLNDEDFEIVVELRNTKEQPYFCYKDKAGNKKQVAPTSSKDDVYTFKDKWKQILTPARKDDIYLRLGKDGELIKPLLVPIPSVINQPTDIGAMLGVKNGLGINFTIPGINLKTSVNLTPNWLEKWLPKGGLDIAGTAYLMFGRAPTKEEQGDTLQWKKQWKDDYDKKYSKLQKNATFSNLKQQYGALRDAYGKQKLNFMGKGGITAGVYGFLIGKWQMDGDKDNYYVSVRGGAGVTVSFNVDFVAQFFIGVAPIGVPAYADLNINLSVGFCFSLDLDFVLDKNKKVVNWKLVPDDFSIDARLTISLTIGVGMQGVASLWAKGAGYIDIATQISLLSGNGTTLNINGGANVTAGATLLWITVSAEVWHYGPKLLYSSSSNAAYSLLDHYMPDDGLKKNDDGNVAEPVYMGPDEFPELVPTAQPVITDLSNASETVKIVSLGGDTYIFYIKDGKISWYNVNKQKEGCVADVVAMGKESYPGGYGEADKLDGAKDYAFDVRACSAGFSWRSEAGSDKPWWLDPPGDFLAVTGLCAKDFDENGIPKKEANNACFYALFMWRNSSDGSLVCTVNNASNWIGFFRSAWMGEGNAVSYVATNAEFKQASFSESYQESESQETVFYNSWGMIDVGLTQAQMADDEGAPPSGCFEMDQGVSTFLQSGLYERNPRNSGVKVSSANDVASGGGSDYVRVKTEYAPDHSWVAVSRGEGGEGERGVLEFYDPSMDVAGAGKKRSVVLDKGKIENFALSLIPMDDGKTARIVFYTDNAGSKKTGTRNLLKSAYLAPVDRKDGDGNFELSVDGTSYDIEMPTLQFKLETIGGALNLYWVSTTSLGKKGDVDGYRVNYAVYDQGHNLLSNAQVCAEFALPDADLAIRDLFLTSDGQGYLTASKVQTGSSNTRSPLSLYKFQTKLKPVLDLKGQVIEDTLVCQGDFDDFNVSVMNSGNMAATSLDLELVLHTVDEETKKDTETVEGTMHGDMLDPSQCTVTMGTTKVADGEKAFYRMEDYDITPQRRDWVVSEASKKYTVEGGRLKSTEDKDTKSDYVKTKVLLPGALGVFKSTMKIPTNWEGDKLLELRLASMTSYTNWVGAMAIAAGRTTTSAFARNAAVSNAVGTRLTWVRDPETGDMVLETNKQLQGAHALMVSRVIDGAESVSTNSLHDLVVDDRVYLGPDGEKRLSITVIDLAETRESIKLTGTMYLDDSKEPIPFSLDHFPDVVSSGVAHTFMMPLSALVDEDAHYKVRIVIKGVGIEECADGNNEFTLYLNGKPSPLMFLQQPRDMTVQPGESVTFSVKASGGMRPYSYQWQMWDAKRKKWVDIPGYNDSKLSREHVEKKWDGAKFRCVVTDRSGLSVTSDEAKLTVREKVPTGDNSNLPLYLAVAIIALALLWLLRRRARAAR